MHYKSVRKDLWEIFFDLVSKASQGQQVELEFASLEMGDQIIERWMWIDGIAYDRHKDSLSVVTDVLEHTVLSPREVVVWEEGMTIRSIGIKDADGNLQIIQFREPLLLEAPRSALDSRI